MTIIKKGNVGTPSITFINDPDTGIYSSDKSAKTMHIEKRDLYSSESLTYCGLTVHHSESYTESRYVEEIRGNESNVCESCMLIHFQESGQCST